MLKGYIDYLWQTIKVEGKDSTEFLHKITTQDIRALKESSSHTSFGLTNRLGTVLSYGFIRKLSNESYSIFFQDLPGISLPTVFDGYRILEKVEWKPARPIHATYTWGESLQEEPLGQNSFRPHCPIGIFFHEPASEPTHDQDVLDAEWECIRIQNGIPRLEYELIAKRLPFEIGLAHAVSLNKGCFTGQEVLTKFAHRGSYPRALAYLKTEGKISWVSSNDWRTKEVQIIDESTGASPTLTSVAPDNGNLHVLAILPRTDQSRLWRLIYRDHIVPLSEPEFFI